MKNKILVANRRTYNWGEIEGLEIRIPFIGFMGNNKMGVEVYAHTDVSEECIYAEENIILRNQVSDFKELYEWQDSILTEICKEINETKVLNLTSIMNKKIEEIGKLEVEEE